MPRGCQPLHHRAAGCNGRVIRDTDHPAIVADGVSTTERPSAL
nr:MAG TPA: hypothetical protein [Caudoviricetes sp.]